MVHVVLITAKDIRQARQIARQLLMERLAACVNLVPGVQSYFRWQGKIDEAREVLLVVKTRRLLLKKIIRRVKELHSYSTPEIVALPVVGGSAEYLTWVQQETTK